MKFGCLTCFVNAVNASAVNRSCSKCNQPQMILESFSFADCFKFSSIEKLTQIRIPCRYYASFLGILTKRVMTEKAKNL